MAPPKASEILVQEGELVSKGQILIKLDNRQTENMLLKTNKLLSINKDNTIQIQ